MKRILRDTVAAVIVVAGAATAFAQGGPGAVSYTHLTLPTKA